MSVFQTTKSVAGNRCSGLSYSPGSGCGFIGVKSVYTCTAANMAYRKVIFEQNRMASKTENPASEDNYFLHCTKTQVTKSQWLRFRIDYSDPWCNQFLSFHESKIPLGGLRWKHYYSGVKLFFIPALLFYLSIWIALLSAFFHPQYCRCYLGDCRKNVFRLSAYSQIYFPL